MRKPFEKWQWEELEEQFGLRNTPMLLLDNWLKNEQTITSFEAQQLTPITQTFAKFYENWNEDELKMQFIAPILTLINYYDTGFMPFSQRNISAILNNCELYGRVDWMLAKGIQNPKNPYVFIHEYKPEKGRSNDPKGQLLSEMLAAQTTNDNEKPIYGAYVTGKDWYFVVLNGINYNVSRPYQANEAHDIDIIIKALKEIKNILKTF